MPPMSRPLMTAWATVSHIWLDRRLSFQQRLAGVFLREPAGEIAVLPLHADRAAVDVLAVGTEFYLAARCHRRIARRDIERRQGFANLLRIGRGRALERVSQHEGLRDKAAGVLEQEFAGALLEFGVHLLRIVADVMIPVRHALQPFGELADILVEVRNHKAAGAA